MAAFADDSPAAGLGVVVPIVRGNKPGVDENVDGHRLRAALDSGGTPVAWQHRGAMAGGGAGERELTPPYALQGLDLSMVSASLSVPVGAWRSVIHSAVVFVNESFMDELATAAGQDPLAYRRRFVTNRRVLGVLDRAAAEIGWNDTLPAGAGRGIACAACFGSYVATAVELAVEGNQVRLRRVVVAVDCGLPVNPRGVESQIQGAAIDGLSTAFRAAVSLKGGAVQQSSFHDFEWFRLGDAPAIEVHLVTGNSSSPGGIGEVGYPTVAPAVANAVFAATGRRLRRLPMTELTVIGAAVGAAPTPPPPATATARPPEPTATAPAPSPTSAVEPTATGQPAAEQDKLFMPRLGGD